MRCLKCGYDNEPNAQVCIKCGQPYNNVSAPRMPQQYQASNGNLSRPTVIDAGLQNVPQQPRPTVVDASMQSVSPQPRPTVLDGNAAMNAQSCPACGYPTQGKSVCPSCGYPIAKVPQPSQPVQHKEAVVDMNMTTVCDKCGQEVSISNKFCPNCGERIHLSTQPLSRRKPQPKCSLTIIPEEEEHISTTQNKYEGKSIILNRDNTEPGNRTITSREQAELTYEDGKWYIENKSDYDSTYVMAKRRIELQPGDIVVLGDRTFEFNCPEKEGK